MRRLQQHVLQVAEQWHGAGAQHSCVGRWGRISIDQIASVTQHPTLIRSVLGYLAQNLTTGFTCGVFTEHRTPRRGPSKRPPDEQIQGERVTFIYRTTSPASPLRVARLPRALLYPVFGGDEPHRAVGCWIRRGRRSTTSPCARGTPPLGAVSPPTHELGEQKTVYPKPAPRALIRQLASTPGLPRSARSYS